MVLRSGGSCEKRAARRDYGDPAADPVLTNWKDSPAEDDAGAWQDSQAGAAGTGEGCTTRTSACSLPACRHVTCADPAGA